MQWHNIPLGDTMLKLIQLAGSLLIFASYWAFAATDAEHSPIQIAIYDEAPFGYLDKKGRYSGLMVEMWEDIADELDLEYEYTLTNMGDLIKGVKLGEYSVGLGAITITPHREALVDFSQPVNASGTGIVVAKKGITSTFSTFVWPITVAIIKLAIALAALLLVSGMLVWWVERNHKRDPGHRDIDSPEDGLWWSAVTISTIGYGDKVPQTRLGRIIGVIWIFAGLVMLSLFTANASAIFTVTKIESTVENREDLNRVRVGAAKNSSGAEYLIREKINYLEYTDINSALDSLLSGHVDAVVSNILVVRYLNNQIYKRELLISPKLLLSNNMGIALTPNSELEEPINRALLRLVSEPKWQSALTRYLGEE